MIIIIGIGIGIVVAPSSSSSSSTRLNVRQQNATAPSFDLLATDQSYHRIDFVVVVVVVVVIVIIIATAFCNVVVPTFHVRARVSAFVGTPAQPN